MKHKAPVTLLAVVFGLALGAAQADTTDTTGTKPTNAAMPAVTNGPGQAATPAMPGNPTAQQKVTENRAKADANRQRAADNHAAGAANADHGTVDRPTMSRPDISRPEVSHR